MSGFVKNKRNFYSKKNFFPPFLSLFGMLTHALTLGMLVLLSITKVQSFPFKLWARRYFRTKARFSELVPPSPPLAP